MLRPLLCYWLKMRAGSQHEVTQHHHSNSQGDAGVNDKVAFYCSAVLLKIESDPCHM